MHDFLANLTDEDVRATRAIPIPHHSPSYIETENPALRFVYDDYDWAQFKPAGYVPLKLTQGFFTFVSEEDAEKLAGQKVCANVWRCPETGGIMRVCAVYRDKNTGKREYLHRLLKGAVGTDATVDHVNNWPLDNRSDKNLWATTLSLNVSNRVYTRTNKLPRGVAKVRNRYRGQIWYRGVAHFSPVMKTVREAHEWYLSKYHEFHGALLQSGQKPERNYPSFPPRKRFLSIEDTF